MIEESRSLEEADHAPGLQSAFVDDIEEDSYVVEQIEGSIPPFVQGTYYLNGPARFQRNELRYRHWLDGDGIVCALRFDRGKVNFTNRYVRSEKLEQEDHLGRPVYRGFGTSFSDDRLVRRLATASPYNVSVYPYGGKLLIRTKNCLSKPFYVGRLTCESKT